MRVAVRTKHSNPVSIQKKRGQGRNDYSNRGRQKNKIGQTAGMILEDHTREAYLSLDKASGEEILERKQRKF